jgi:O-antigen ligase
MLFSFAVTFSFTLSVKEFIKWLLLAGIYLFVASQVDARTAKLLVASLLLAGISQALLGFYQFFFRVGPEGFLLFDRFIRAYGTFEQPNPYGGYLILGLPLAYTFFVGDWRRERGVPSPVGVGGLGGGLAMWMLGGVALVTMGAALVMTWSRGAWLGFAAAFVVVNVLRSKRAAVIFTGLAIGVVFVLLLGSFQAIPPVVAERLTGVLPYLGVFDARTVEVTNENFAVVERMAHWQAGWGMFSDYPLLGVGIGAYAAAYPRYALPRWPDPLGHAHNYYLNVAAETGLIGLAAYLVLWLAVFWQGWLAVRRSRGWLQAMALGALGALVALSFHNLTDNLFVHGMNVQVGMLLGLIAVATRLSSGER